MKIIAGKFKGRNLEYRTRQGLRVTSQKVKEAMYSILGKSIEDARVLDLYCGLGTLGIEGISRGASHVTFVDVDANSLKQLKFFIDKLEIESQTAIIKRDAIKAIKQMEPDSFDIIIMDPPYHVGCEVKTMEAIQKCKILKAGGICVVEHYEDNPLPQDVDGLQLRKAKVYGDTSLSIYMLPKEGEEVISPEDRPEIQIERDSGSSGERSIVEETVPVKESSE